ncbi:MAG: hypothetical protein ACD_79C01305G0001, partial [uncultured bacterium]
LSGAIPFAYIYCKLKGTDIRKVGSGNVGATNAARLFGKKAFFIIFFLDALKGFLPLIIFQDYIPKEYNKELITVIFFVSCVCGHIWTIFLNFKGGKGVAVSVGGLLAVMPKAFLAVFIVFLIIFMISRIVSLGSIFSALTLPFFSWYFYHSMIYLIFSILLAVLIIFAHRSNIFRLIKGEEHSFSKKEKEN